MVLWELVLMTSLIYMGKSGNLCAWFPPHPSSSKLILRHFMSCWICFERIRHTFNEIEAVLSVKSYPPTRNFFSGKVWDWGKVFHLNCSGNPQRFFKVPDKVQVPGKVPMVEKGLNALTSSSRVLLCPAKKTHFALITSYFSEIACNFIKYVH